MGRRVSAADLAAAHIARYWPSGAVLRALPPDVFSAERGALDVLGDRPVAEGQVRRTLRASK